jgi:hypothetical protein
MGNQKKVALLILDGWGFGKQDHSDAIHQAKTPVFDRLIKEHPNATLLTDGKNVGLPHGQMGNSEVGHLNIGAGRVVYQDLVKINKAVDIGELAKNETLLQAFDYAKKENKKVHFSSANRKLFVVDNNKNVQLFRGSRYPIGGWQIEDNRSFVSSIIPYEKGTMLYLGSDGFQDQIGERNNKKFKSKNLHRLLSEISCHTVSDQEYLLNHEFEDWKGNSTQTDDVCLIGVRL